MPQHLDVFGHDAERLIMLSLITVGSSAVGTRSAMVSSLGDCLSGMKTLQGPRMLQLGVGLLVPTTAVAVTAVTMSRVTVQDRPFRLVMASQGTLPPAPTVVQIQRPVFRLA